MISFLCGQLYSGGGGQFPVSAEGNVSPTVIRILAVPDSLLLNEFDAVFRAVLGWENIGSLFRVHGQEFNSFRRATRSRTLREFQLRPTETCSVHVRRHRSLGMGSAAVGGRTRIGPDRHEY